MENYNFEVDEDTIIVLNIISRFLKKYFKYLDDDDVVAAINNFYSKRRPDFLGENESDFIDLYFHHDHPFIVAGLLRIFFWKIYPKYIRLDRFLEIQQFTNQYIVHYIDKYGF